MPRLLSRADVINNNYAGYETVLGQLFRCLDPATGGLPVAAFEWPDAVGEPLTADCLRADPVHLQADRDNVRLLGKELLQLSDEESRALVESINKHFAEDGLCLRAAGDQRWFLTASRALDVDMGSPDYVAGRNIHHFMPGGESATYWKSLLNEVQMLLHMHPVNQRRLENGQLPVNSIWLWGGGRPPESVDGRQIIRVYADQPLIRLLSKFCGWPVDALSECQQAFSKEGDWLIVDDALQNPSVYGNPEDWQRHYERITHSYLEPAYEALKRGVCDEVVIHTCNKLQLEVKRKDLWKFWRRAGSVVEHFAQSGQTL